MRRQTGKENYYQNRSKAGRARPTRRTQTVPLRLRGRPKGNQKSHEYENVCFRCQSSQVHPCLRQPSEQGTFARQARLRDLFCPLLSRGIPLPAMALFSLTHNDAADQDRPEPHRPTFVLRHDLGWSPAKTPHARRRHRGQDSPPG